MTWHSQFQLDTNALAKRCPQREFLCARHHCHHHILAECVRRECLHLLPFSLRFPSRCFPLVCVSVQVSGGVFVLGPRKVSQDTAHSRVVKQDLCSNLCSTPVIAVAPDPPDPVNGGS